MLDAYESEIKGELILKSERLTLRKRYRAFQAIERPKLRDRIEARRILERIRVITSTLEKFGEEVNE
jgi:hypothetical protein